MNPYVQGAPAKELVKRIQGLQARMAAGGVDAALIIQRTDFFYFSGTVQQGWLWIPVQGEPLLMIFKEFDRARIESPLENIVSLVSPRKIPDLLRERGMPLPGRLGMELDVLPANLYFLYKKIFNKADILDVATEIRLERAVKSDYEIGLMQRAAVLSDRVAAHVPEILEAGKSEVALAGELEAFARSLGHQGIVRMRLWGSEIFYGHLMSGPSAAVPSYLSSPTGGSGTSPAMGQGAGLRAILKGEPLLVDYVFALDGYLSDHARIFSMGPLPDKLVRAHDAMLELQEAAKEMAVPGLPAGDLYEMMVVKAGFLGYGDSFMGVGDRRIRFTGHGLGLELDEFPFIAKGQSMTLEKNMVFALEPKVIFPGLGVVGIENTHLVTDQGLNPLTRFPDQIAIL